MSGGQAKKPSMQQSRPQSGMSGGQVKKPTTQQSRPRPGMSGGQVQRPQAQRPNTQQVKSQAQQPKGQAIRPQTGATKNQPIRPQQAAKAGSQMKLPQQPKGSPVHNTKTTAKPHPTVKAHTIMSSDLQELKSFIDKLPSATNVPAAEQSAFEQLLQIVKAEDVKQANLASPKATGLTNAKAPSAAHG